MSVDVREPREEWGRPRFRAADTRRASPRRGARSHADCPVRLLRTRERRGRGLVCDSRFALALVQQYSQVLLLGVTGFVSPLKIFFAVTRKTSPDAPTPESSARFPRVAFVPASARYSRATHGTEVRPTRPSSKPASARSASPEALLIRLEYSARARNCRLPKTPRVRVRPDTVGSPSRGTLRARSLTAPLSRHRASRQSGFGRDRTDEDRIMVRRARPRAPNLPRDAIPRVPLARHRPSSHPPSKSAFLPPFRRRSPRSGVRTSAHLPFPSASRVLEPASVLRLPRGSRPSTVLGG